MVNTSELRHAEAQEAMKAYHDTPAQAERKPIASLAFIMLLLFISLMVSRPSQIAAEQSNLQDPDTRLTNNTTNNAQAIKIITEMEALYQGQSSQATITMDVVTPQFQRTLKMQSSSMGTQHSFIRILSPRKERGIATLKISEEMWNYFPRINKVVKVPPSMMMGAWMGSDFTNDDLVKQTTLTDEYNLTMETTQTQYIISLVPKQQTVTVWGKIDYVVQREHMTPASQSFYDEDGTLIRKMEFSQLKDFSGRLIPSILTMTPINKPGHQTIITYNQLEFQPHRIDDSVFTLRHLKSRF